LRVLGYPKFRLPVEDRAALLEDYLPFAEVVFMPEPPPPLDVDCRDADDIIFLGLALASGADFLVTGDDDLISIQTVGSVPIVSIDAFRRAVNA
jgi:putative PIN family toxin of toxin-antitoxin system